jgi:D-lactate dehydrogenase
MHAQDDVRTLPAPYRELHAELLEFLPPGRIVSDPLRRLALGTDASFYRLVPQLVVQLRTASEVARLLAAARRRRLPVTFRAGGTSLSGQAVSDSILATVAGAFRGARVFDRGERIALEPGVIGVDANALLVPYGRKLGPDPASIGACMIGGIVANNASGMCCGTAENSYRTVEAMKLLLADGTPLDTGDAGGGGAFRGGHTKGGAGPG